MVLASLEKRPSVALDNVVEKDGHIIAGLVYKQQAFDSLVFPYMTCPCSPVSSLFCLKKFGKTGLGEFIGY